MEGTWNTISEVSQRRWEDTVTKAVNLRRRMDDLTTRYRTMDVALVREVAPFLRSRDVA